MNIKNILASWLVPFAVLGAATAVQAQTVTSQISGSFPNFSWPEWDQAQSGQMSINTDPSSPGAIYGCWTGMLLNQYPGYAQSGPWFATWNMTVPSAGLYMLEMEYAMDASSLRPGDVSVNGALQASNALGAATGGW